MMKILIVIMLAVAILVIGGSISSLESSQDRINFECDEGSEPWLTHIPSEINTTFHAALEEHRYLRRLVCVGDSTDHEINPFGPIQPVCMEGKGAKMVVPMGYPEWSHLVFASPKEGGLFEQQHMTKSWPIHYYDKSMFRTKYFLIPFDDYEIPTYHPIESRAYLPIWKRLFQSINDMDDEYFKEHIMVMSAYVRHGKFRGKHEQYFTIVYYYHVDWAQIKLQDGFVIGQGETKLHEVVDSVTLIESLRFLEEGLKLENRTRSTYITTIELTASIASKDEITEAVSIASPLLGSDVNKHLGLNRRGQLILSVYGTVEDSANLCLKADVLLKNASVSELQEMPCWIY